MKLLTSITITLLSFCVANITLAQQLNKPGFVVLNNGDTLSGRINYKNWKKNPNQIIFQNDSLSNHLTKYSVAELTSFEITGLDKYIRAVVEKDTRPVNLNNLLEGSENIFITDTVFLRQIVGGSKIDLYELVDSKYHFFIKDSTELIKELIYKVFINEHKNVVSQKNYINQLRALFGQNKIPPSLENKINSAGYQENDLKSVVTAINNMFGSVYYSVNEKSSNRIKSSFFGGIGVGYSSLQFKGNFLYLDKMTYTGSFSPYVTLGMDVSEQRNLQSLFIRLELSWYSVDYKGSGETEPDFLDTDNVILKYKLSQRNISPSFSIFYNFINMETLRIYAGAGVTYNFSSYSENKLTTIKQGNISKEYDNYIVPSKHWVNLSAKLGLNVSKRWDVGLSAGIYGAFTNYPVFSLNPNMYSAQLRYYFK